MRVLVTGAAGFIGSRLVERLLALECQCFGIDNLHAGTCPPTARANLEFECQDICERDRVEAIFNRFLPTAVVHLAAIHHIPTCEQNASEALRVNIVGFQIVLDAAAKVGCQRMILASSGAIYDWQEGPLNEDRTPVKPRDIYSLSKATNEKQLEFWTAKTGATAIVARIFNTIGENDPNRHLIPDILRQVDSNGRHPLIRLGNLYTRRDYIYVEDTAACLASMVEADDLKGLEFFNVGTGREYDVRSIVEHIARIRGCSLELQADPTLARKMDRHSQLADITKAVSRLNWRPLYSLEEALKRTVAQERP